MAQRQGAAAAGGGGGGESAQARRDGSASESEGGAVAVAVAARRRWRRGCGPAGELAAAAAAEAAGTLLLVLLTCLPAAPAAPLLARALTAGLVVALLVQCLDHISGAMFNPTVTLAAVVAGRLAAPRAAALVAAQVAGALASALALRLLAPAAAPAACLTRPAPGLPVLQALSLEAVLGGCLALANCAAWDARNRRLLDSWPLRIGLCVTALSLVAGDLTGASMNPLRSLGPSLCAGDWTHHWIYWVGPLSGSALVSLAYRAAWAAPPTVAPRPSSPPARRRTPVKLPA